MLSDWVRVVKKTSQGRIAIHHRPDDVRWADQAVAYWEGRLAGLEPVPSSKFARVHRRENYYFKRYLVRGWRDAFKNLFRASRARRALERGEDIESLGFYAPRAVCLIESGRECALVTEAINNAPNFREWLNKPELGVVTSRKKKRALLRAVAEVVAAWHNAGLHHADLRIGNLLCRQEAGLWKFFWLDNEGVTRHRRVPEDLRVHNLMQVNMERTGVTLTDRLFFWRCYAAKAGIRKSDERRIMRAVIDYTRQRWKERGWL